MNNPTFNEDYSLIVAPGYDPRYTPVGIPSAGVFDEPTYMICINAEWWGHVGGVLSRLAELDAWKSDDIEEKREAVQSALLILQEIGKRVECGMSQFLLRQSPTNSCILQQSSDGGQTWITAFNYSLCSTGGGGQTINITNAQTYIEHVTNQWNTDIDIVYNNITINDGDTNASYCHALKVLIIGILQGALERLQNGNNQELVIQAIVGGVSIAGAFIFGTPLAGLTTAIGVTLSLATSAVMGQLDENKIARVLGDDGLLDEIRCCAYQNIENTKVSELSFSQMFDSCSSTNADVENAYVILREVVGSFDVFITFLEAVNVAYDYSVSGALANNCSCLPCQRFELPPPNAEYEILYGVWDDTAVTPDGTPVINNADGVNSAVYPLNASGSTAGIVVAVRLTYANPITVDELRMSYRMNADGNVNLIRGWEIREHTTDALLQRSSVARPENNTNLYQPVFSDLGHSNVGSVVVWVSKTSDPATLGDADILDVCVS